MSALTDSADVFVYSADPANDRIIFGTVMLGNTFGQIIKADLARTGSEDEIANAIGGLRAYLISNPGFELDLETIMSANVSAPGLMTSVTFPLAGVTGVVSPGTMVSWEEGGVRKLKFKAKAWDSLAGASVTKWDGSAHTLV